MKRCEINIRDPFVLLHEKKYYLYGTRGKSIFSRGHGFDVYVADCTDGTSIHDAEWNSPIEVFRSCEYGLEHGPSWAPEVHYYKGAFYMLATFQKPNGTKGTYILKSDKPDGRFSLHSEGAVPPYEWENLDGTLYISPDGTPYMVFCHEWIQIQYGTICAVKLSEDLKRADGEPFLILDSKNAFWVRPEDKTVVTDGPFLYRTSHGELLMIWSSFAGGYMTVVAKSSNGDVTGSWSLIEYFLCENDSGHGMIFRDIDNNLLLSVHSPNSNGNERPEFIPIKEHDKRGLIIV